MPPPRPSKMDTSATPPLPWIRYVMAAHLFGLTVKATLDDLNTCGYNHVTAEDTSNILKDNGRIPKFLYPWYNWIIKATKGQNPMGIHPWNPWPSRFILMCNANKDDNSTIFTKLQHRGFEIPGEHWVGVVLTEHQDIENGLALGGAYQSAAFEKFIVRAHNWGYTLSEITRRNAFNPSQASNSSIHFVKTVLARNGVPETYQREGRGLGTIAEEFVASAYNLGMDVNSIRNQMYVHGFDYWSNKPISDLLKEKGIWQGEKSLRAKSEQEAYSLQRRSRDNILGGEDEAGARSPHVNAEHGQQISLMDLLN